MASHDRSLAALHSGLIRAPRAAQPAEPHEQEDEVSSGWSDDARLFGLAWLAGFVFFLAYLS